MLAAPQPPEHDTHDYDATVVFGMRHNRATDPQNFFNSLDAAVKAYRQQRAPWILVSGRGRIGSDRPDFVPESQVGADYLSKQGIFSLQERASTSAVQNMLAVKFGYTLPFKWGRLLCPIAEYAIPRRELLARKIFGASCQIDFESVACPPEEIYPDETGSLRYHEELLQDMPEGDHSFLFKDGVFIWPQMVENYLRVHDPHLFEGNAGRQV